MSCSRRTAGVSLVEIVIVLSVAAILVGALVPRVTDRMASSRDLRRLADMHTIVRAIERYRADHGALPAAQENASYGGWDVSQDGDFIPDLVKGGYLPETMHDPIDDETYDYRYFVYAAGTAGCKCSGEFYVLADDAIIGPAIARGMWEEHETRLFRAHLAPGCRVLDLGANVGWFGVQAVMAGCEVHCFEPVPAIADVCATNLERAMRKGKGRAVLHRCAAGSERGR